MCDGRKHRAVECPRKSTHYGMSCLLVSIKLNALIVERQNI